MTLFQFNLYSIPPLISGLFIILFGIYIFTKNPRSATHFSWLLVCFSLFTWLIAEFALISTKNINFALSLTKIIYIGVTGIPFCILYFSYKITKTPISILYFALLAFLYFAITLIFSKTNLFISGVHYYFWGFYPRVSNFHIIYLFFWGLIYICGLKILYIRICSPKIEKIEKNRIQFCFWSFIFGGIIGSIDFLPKYGIEFYPIGYFCIPFVIIPLGIAIYKHNLLDISIVVKKGLLYSILLSILTGIYLLLILFIEQIFKGAIGYRSTLVSLFSAFIIAILFNPLRNKIQKYLDKIFLGKTLNEIFQENMLLRQELERSERLKTASTLALGLAHEIRNPITVIKTFAEYLPNKLDDKEFLKKFAKLVPGETIRINNIIQQLLQFSKPTPPKFQKVHLHQLIQETLSFLNNEFFKRKIKLNEIYDNKNNTILADSEQIKQVLLNIIFNSMDAMPAGGTIFLETKKLNDSFLELSVQDEGYGIAKEDLPHVFDPFFSKKESGTGLGLAITHQIIKNHGGSIEVKSELGKFTAFKIKLPFH